MLHVIWVSDTLLQPAKTNGKSLLPPVGASCRAHNEKAEPPVGNSA
jgi:hypothetical protein